MGKIAGLGGVFIKAKDPKALANWYEQNLGIGFSGGTYVVMPFDGQEGKPPTGYNIFSVSPWDTSYFEPSVKHFMINLRVEDMDGLLEDLKKKGVEIVGDPLNEEYGKFAWIMDPEGNKIELWEPPAGE
jgi:predicted enzyme related to lactoylglutathione lyase